MFNRKYKDAMAVLDDEIEMAYDVMIDYAVKAAMSKDDIVRDQRNKRANEWAIKVEALEELRSHIHTLVEP